MKLKFINLSTADFVLTQIRGILYLLLGALAGLNYVYDELGDIREASHLVRHLLRLELTLPLVLFALTVGFFSFLVTLPILNKRALDLKYAESTFCILALAIAFGTSFLWMPPNEDMVVRSLVRVFCTHAILFLVFIDLCRLFFINVFLKRCLLKAREKA